MGRGRPSIRNKGYWKTQLAQYDPANYNTELQYHQVFAEKFKRSYDKLRPSIKKFISSYYASHKNGMSLEDKATFYQLHPDVYPAATPAPHKGGNPNSDEIKDAIKEVQVARGQIPDKPGAKRKWGAVDVNATDDDQFNASRKRDLLLSLSTEEEKNPSDDPDEKKESTESAYDLNKQQNSNLHPEKPNQDPGTENRADKEKRVLKQVDANYDKTINAWAQRGQSEMEVAVDRWRTLNPQATPSQLKAYKQQLVAVYTQSNPRPDKAKIQKEALVDSGLNETQTPDIRRTTETEEVRGAGSSDAATRRAWQQFGDRVVDTDTVDTATPSLRPQYGMEGASSVVPSTAKQLASDLGFDMFSWVNKGFGNGSDNKIFLQQEARDKLVRYAGDMYGPGPHPGPIGGVKPMSMAWSSVKSKGFIDKVHNDFQSSSKLCARVYDDHVHQNDTARALPDDVGSQHLFSSKELPRKMLSPLEPMYNNYSVFRPVRDAAGFQRPRNLSRHRHDPIRYPYNVNKDLQSGMQILPKRLAMQEILV